MAITTKEPEIAGCWSGLRALVAMRIKRRKPARARDMTTRVSTSFLSLKSTGEYGITPTSAELPPEYCAPPYSDIEPIVKDERERTAVSAAQIPNKFLSLEVANTSDHRWLSRDVNYAHDSLARFVEQQAFHVTSHYLADQLPGNTARKAEFIIPNKLGGSLPGIGHACGHNLIAIIGVTAAVGLKNAMEKHGIPGRIILLGTPAEEAGGGKVYLLKAGAYKDMDICLTAHPGPGDSPQIWDGPTLALQTFTVEYHGQSAHAGAAPWEGINALYAAFVAYTAISAMRRQIHPTARVHGIVEGRDRASNVIPNYAKMKYTVRAPTWSEVVALRARVNRCFEAAALATSCTMEITEHGGVKDVRGNEVLSNEFGALMTSRYGYSFNLHMAVGASTDFGNVTYELPALHPGFVYTMAIMDKEAKAPGCWSGLRALVAMRTKRHKPARDLATRISTSFPCPTKPTGEYGITTSMELPPEYRAPPYSDIGPIVKDKQKKTVIDAIRVPHEFPSPEAANTSDHAIDELNSSLRELNLQIHDNPELSWDVGHAHDTLTRFVEKQGFCVTRHYLADQLPGNTAWKAEFIIPNKLGGSLPVIGFNSEMDALPGIGHACGHNLIATIGVAAAVGLKNAMEKHGIPGRIILLGTPAEEAGEGKVHLLKAGAYKEMDICLMAHPGPGDNRQIWDGPTLALQTFTVEYHGQSAHAGAAPWEGINALDAAFVAYTAISALRRDWASNIIPNYAKMKYTVRAPTWGEVVALRARVNRCFEAAALATSCTMEITENEGLKDVQGNKVLSGEFGALMTSRYDYPFEPYVEIGASTDFGNVTYELPALHPGFAIPTVPNGGNHTPEYTAAARTQEAHERAVAVSKGLAVLGLRAVLDEEFLHTVKDSFRKHNSV
ncbi:Peptidase M20 domain-containing protein 2 [Rhizoctonia solani]|uniref:Peptidase M20 domain-containing protein 2 n=1 Tax=Rhizoctonia solani TaxID=456999 RepID=A0A0K6GHK9_9AGAM|nr:Peptidase M20 domain-containing protein 2 [Rhizoctonia solani]